MNFIEVLLALATFFKNRGQKAPSPNLTSGPENPKPWKKILNWIVRLRRVKSCWGNAISGRLAERNRHRIFFDFLVAWLLIIIRDVGFSVTQMDPRPNDVLAETILYDLISKNPKP